jgi:hypothetical protein
MRKIKLNLDTLRIDSFATGAQETQRGTVHGRATEFVCSWLPTCPGQPTCGQKTCAC